MQDYELRVVSRDKDSDGETFRAFNVDNESVIGVQKDEPFELIFKNNTDQKVQVRLSLDGTDILTGELASTKPQGKMWLVAPHDTMKLHAWPEDSKGGARFVFASENKSVAVNTHGSTAGIGLIGAAVYTERYASTYVRSVPGIFARTSIRRGCKDAVTVPTASAAPAPAPAPASAGEGKNTVDFAGADFDSLAVGAGEHVEQKIEKRAGLRRPVLHDVIQLRYMPWSELSQLVEEERRGATAFPGDSEEKGVDLSSVPKVKSTAKKPSRTIRKRAVEVQRFV